MRTWWHTCSRCILVADCVCSSCHALISAESSDIANESVPVCAEEWITSATAWLVTELPIKPCTLLSRRLTDVSLSLAHQTMHQMLPLRHSVQGQTMPKSNPPILLQMLMVLLLLRTHQLDSNKLLACMKSRHSLIKHSIRLPVSSHSMLSRLVLQACLLHLAHMLSTLTQHSMDSIRATALVYGKALAQASRAGQAVLPPP